MRSLTALTYIALSSVYGDETCLLPVDVMILQDTTGSFVDDLPNVASNIPSIVSGILEQNPGSWFGAAEHKDKPYRDLGEPNDFCYRLATKLASSVDAFQEAYNKLYASGGGDLPEAQLQALINVAQDPAAGWRSLAPKETFSAGSAVGVNALSDKTGARLIILSTDAVPHDPGDYTMYNEEPLPQAPRPPAFLPPYPNDPTSVSSDAQCTSYDYPNMQQAADVLKANNVNVVFLVPEIETNAVAKWRLFSETYLGQPESFVQYIMSDSSNILEVVLKALAEVSDYVCNATTTPMPTTTTGTTLAPTAPPTTTTAETTTTATTPAPTTTATTPAPTTTTTTLAPTTTTTAPVTTSTTTASTTAATPTTQMTKATASGCECPAACATGPCDCACPEVIIKLRQRPMKLHMDVSN